MVVAPQYSAYKDVQWFGKPHGEITVIGAGGIGSNVAFQLGRLGFPFTIYDNDRVEIHNMSQMFTIKQVNEYKVTALFRTISDFNSAIRINGVTEMWTTKELITDIMFSCVDNMKTRIELFAKWRDSRRGNNDSVFIDARLNSEDMKIFVITGRDDKAMNEYMSKWLFSDAEASEPLCTNKQTPHIGTICGSLMVALFTNWLCRNDVLSRTLPFKTEIHIPLMLVTNEYL